MAIRSCHWKYKQIKKIKKPFQNLANFFSSIFSALVHLPDPDLSLNNIKFLLSIFEQLLNLIDWSIDVFAKLLSYSSSDVQLKWSICAFGGNSEKLAIQVKDFKWMVDCVHYCDDRYFLLCVKQNLIFVWWFYLLLENILWSINKQKISSFINKEFWN